MLVSGLRLALGLGMGLGLVLSLVWIVGLSSIKYTYIITTQQKMWDIVGGQGIFFSESIRGLL